MDLIEVPEEEKQGIIDYYTVKIKEFEEKVTYYKSLISKLNGGTVSELLKEAIVEIDKTSVLEEKEQEISISTTFEIPENNIKTKIPRQNWKFLSLTALNKLDELSTTHELYDFITSDKPTLLDFDKVKVISKISTALSNLYTKGKVNRVKNSLGRGYFWTLPVWYEDNEIKPIYKELLLEKYGVDEASLFGEY